MLIVDANGDYYYYYYMYYHDHHRYHRGRIGSTIYKVNRIIIKIEVVLFVLLYNLLLLGPILVMYI